ncbi:hypothetical protein DID78_04695 [Candidatus Marinamargulisbacteria bacterium SCGC AG-343-D04]|nr:hypothetical protein DID78_04695 [Candidatus Marinamargulisbacteria bacterium SCGC AG-343-D04]
MSQGISAIGVNSSSSSINNNVRGSVAPKIPFQNVLDDVLKNSHNEEVKGIEYNFNQKRRIDSKDKFSELIAQGVPTQNIENVFQDIENRRRRQINQTEEENPELALSTNRMDVTPFQMFIDKAVEVLESISEQDYKVNDLTEQYLQGKVSIDEVSMEITKLNLAVSFATTVLSSVTQTFKEITQIQI